MCECVEYTEGGRYLCEVCSDIYDMEREKLAELEEKIEWYRKTTLERARGRTFPISLYGKRYELRLRPNISGGLSRELELWFPMTLWDKDRPVAHFYIGDNGKIYRHSEGGYMEHGPAYSFGNMAFEVLMKGAE
jgi:hypothetical protein